MTDGRLSSSRTVVRSGFFNVAGYAASVFYMILLVPIAVHYLGIERFALWSITLALTGYLGLADFGVSTSFVKYISGFEADGDREGVRKVIQHGLLFYVLLSAVIIIAGILLFPLLFVLVGLPSGAYGAARDAFTLSLVNFGFSNAIVVYGSALLGIQRADIYNAIMAAGLLAKLAAVTAVLAAGWGIVGMFAVEAAVNGALIVPVSTAVRRQLPGTNLFPIRYDGTLMRTLLRFGVQLQVGRLAEVVQAQFDKLLLPRFAGLASVSLYDFGSRPLGRLRALPVTAISALVPAVAALDVNDDRERIHAALLRATRYVIIGGLPLFLLLGCFADPVIRLWLGSPYERSALTMQILGAAVFLNVLSSPLSFVAQGMAKLHYQVRATLVQVCTNCVLSVLLILQYGYFGAVTGTALSLALGSVLFVWWFGRTILDHPLRTIGKLLLKPLGNGAVASAVGLLSYSWLARLIVDESRLSVALALAPAVIAFLGVYSFLTLRTGTVTSDDRGFVRGVIPSRFLRPTGKKRQTGATQHHAGGISSRNGETRKGD
jgi:O-antigen/teichoic acid export membrane protein